MANFTIRRAVKRDAQEILDLIKELAEFHNAADMITWTVDDVSRLGFEGEKPAFEVLLAADAEGNTLGGVLYFERFSTWRGPTLHIEDLMVKPEYRGHHIGDALVDEVVKQAKMRGIDRIELDVEGDNEGAVRFYARKGFDTTWHAAKLYLSNGH